jgi:protease-4
MVLAVLALALSGCVYIPIFRPAKLSAVTVEKSPRWFESNRIALIDVDGFLSTSSGDGLFAPGGTSVADLKEKLKFAERDAGVRAVVLRINSPGGEATASDMMYKEVEEFRARTGKPVVACMTSLAASGGYYVAAGADVIIASPTTVTGSVGVIMQFINVEGLFDKIGLRSEVVKSGEKKDVGSPFRALTPEERKMLQDINRSLFDQFVAAVRKGRPQMTEEDVKAASDGRILTAQQAVALHMVDSVGYMSDALATARNMAGIRTADVVLYTAYPSYNSNIYARLGGSNVPMMEEAVKLLLKRRGPMFLYLWSPGS